MNIKAILEIIDAIRNKKQPIRFDETTIQLSKRKNKNKTPKMKTENTNTPNNEIALERARKKIQERIDRGVTAVLTGRKQFKQQWDNENVDDALLYFDKILQAFSLSDEQTITLTAPRYPVPQEFTSVYQHALYEKILPLCQLAYLLENNGNPKDHAFKLSILCSHLSPEETLVKISLYIRQFATQNPEVSDILHDACLFDLPNFNVHRWCAYALSIHNKYLLLLDPIFSKVLPHAAKIEAIEQRKPNTRFNKEQKIDNQTAINTKHTEIDTLTQSIKNIQTKRGQATEHDKKQLDNFTKDKADKLIMLANLYRGKTFNGNNIVLLQAFYELYCSEQNGDAYPVLLQHGITDKSRDVFFKLQRQNDDKTIPNIIISGEELGYPGYFIKKLDTQSDTGAALAACLGKITDCCQHIGGTGESCATHGITSPNGGFYVLCNSADKIVAQAWVWRSQANALCLDSIETSKSWKDKHIAIAMYRYLGFMLCSSDNLSGCPVSHVNVGGQSGISRQAGRKDYFASKEHYRDYAGYSDSKSQLKLADASMPYLFYGKAEGQFKDKVEQQTLVFLNEQFKNRLPLKQNTAIQQVIAFILQNEVNNKSLLDCLNQAGKLRLDELAALITVNQQFRENLEKNSVHLPLLDEGSYCNAMNSKGLSALHIVIINEDAASVASLIEKGINLNIQDKYGNTPLIKALECFYANKTESARDIIKLLVENKAELDIKDKDENTALIIAVTNNDLAMTQYLVEHGADIETFDGEMKTALFLAAEKGFEAIFDYLYKRQANVLLVDYPNKNSLLLMAMRSKNTNIINILLNHRGINLSGPNNASETPLREAVKNLPEFITPIFEKMSRKKQLAAFQATDSNGDTLLHDATSNSESFKIVLNMFSKDKRLAAVQARNKYGQTVLHHAVSSPQTLETILCMYPEDKRLDAVQITDEKGQTILHNATSFHQSLEIILNMHPEDKRLEALQTKDNFDQMVLHKTASSPQSLETILKMLPENKRLAAIQMSNKYGKTVLHLAVSSPQSLEIILNIYPEDKRLEAIQTKDIYGQTVLHLAASSPQSLETILSMLPENKRLEAIQVTDEDSQTILHRAAPLPQSLESILKLYPENRRLEAVQMRDKFGKTVLHLAASHPLSFESILTLLPENKRFEAIMTTNKNRQMVLHQAATYSQSLEILLKLLPRDKCIEALETKDNDGQTILYRAAYNPQSLEAILNIYPENQRLEAIQMTSKYDGQTVLHQAAFEPQSLECILKLLPIDQRLTAVLIQDKSRKTVLHRAAKNPQSLETILRMIPESQRIEILKIKNENTTLCSRLDHIDVFIEDSFASDYIKISKILSDNTLPTASFFSGPESRLIKKFSMALSFEGVKNLIIKFLTENQQHQISKALLTVLTPGENNLDELYRRWNMEPGEEHLKKFAT